MSYTEFYCDGIGGNNMNGGYPIGGVYPITYTNGAWDQTTGVFTPASGNPVTAGVTVGDFAAVFVDGATTPSWVSRITARDATTITASLTVKKGTLPTTAANGRTMKIGGPWKGPNGTDTWPMNNISPAALRNAAGDPYRVNYLSMTYSISAGITENFANETHQGYTTTPGDGGVATLDGGSNAIVLLTSSGVGFTVADFVFLNNGAAGTTTLVTLTGAAARAIRCVFHDSTGIGLNISNGLAYECEAYACNSSGGSNLGGFVTAGGSTFIRCISHDNVGGVTHGFVTNAASAQLPCFNCISDSNTGAGFYSSTTAPMALNNCDIYNNGGAGIDISANTGSFVTATNCNIVKNTGAGIATNAAALHSSVLFNCGYGSGTQANAANSGLGIQEISCGTYAANVTPWTDPANGDFRVSLFAAQDAGRGAFKQTATSYTGTVAKLDIGAGQS